MKKNYNVKRFSFHPLKRLNSIQLKNLTCYQFSLSSYLTASERFRIYCFLRSYDTFCAITYSFGCLSRMWSFPESGFCTTYRHMVQIWISVTWVSLLCLLSNLEVLQFLLSQISHIVFLGVFTFFSSPSLCFLSRYLCYFSRNGVLKSLLSQSVQRVGLGGFSFFSSAITCINMCFRSSDLVSKSLLLHSIHIVIFFFL